MSWGSRETWPSNDKYGDPPPHLHPYGRGFWVPELHHAHSTCLQTRDIRCRHYPSETHDAGCHSKGRGCAMHHSGRHIHPGYIWICEVHKTTNIPLQQNGKGLPMQRSPCRPWGFASSLPHHPCWDAACRHSGCQRWGTIVLMPQKATRTTTLTHQPPTRSPRHSWECSSP